MNRTDSAPREGARRSAKHVLGIALGAALAALVSLAAIGPTAARAMNYEADSGGGGGSLEDSLEEAPDRVQAIREASDEEFSGLVDEGTIYDEGGEFNYRYFDTGSGGYDEGMLVFDFFISGKTSAFVIEGDDRGHQEPFNAAADESRIKVVLDRSTGRGVVVQNDTRIKEGSIPVDVPWVDFVVEEKEPRPIVVNGSGILRDGKLPNHFDIETGPDSVKLSYDALNSLTPVTDVQGGLSVKREVGFWESTGKWGDDYPSIGVYYYDAYGGVQEVVTHDQQKPVCGSAVGVQEYVDCYGDG